MPIAPALALALAAAVQSQEAPPALPAPAPQRTIVLDRPETAGAPAALQVSSTTVAAGGFFPLANSGYGRNYSPSVQWSKGPDGTKSYVLIVEDPDAGDARPLLHWLVYDIQPDILSMRDKTKNLVHVAEPAPPDLTAKKGFKPKEGPSFDQGINDHGGVGWTGPHPPVGDPPHHYHVQVFALNAKNIGKPGLELDRVLAGMKGHVIAKGEMVALYQQRPDKVRTLRNADKKPAGPDAPTENPALPAPDFGKPKA